eukprot:176674_1
MNMADDSSGNSSVSNGSSSYDSSESSSDSGESSSDSSSSDVITESDGNFNEQIIHNIFTETSFEPNNPNAENAHFNIFDSLSDDMIAYITSHLSLRDHIKFSRCNKLIFISVRSKPMSISHTKFDLNQIKLISYCRFVENKSNTLKHRFIHLKGIELDLYRINKFDPYLFPNIQDLVLDFSDGNKKKWQQQKAKNIEFILENMNFSCINRTTIAEAFGPDSENIVTILNKMNNIEYISFISSDDLVTPFENKLQKLNALKNLKGLHCLYDFPQLIDQYKYQLQSLHIDGEHLMNYEKINIFTKLKELCIYYFACDYNYNNKYKSFLKCSRLERVHIKVNYVVGY